MLPSLPPQSWVPAPPNEGGFHAQQPQHSWDPKQIWNEFNNPPDPQYGIPEGQRSAETDYSHNQSGQQHDGQRGLGANLVGGAGGAFLGHKMAKKHQALGTAAGLALGVLAAHEFDKQE